MMSEIWNLSTLCRCCHADGQFKSLDLTYQGKNDVEIYETMLRDTLGIFISTQPVPRDASYTICDSCIFKLREATEFKNQVLMCEQKFKSYCNNEQFVDTCDIKSEGENYESDLCDEYNIEVDIKHPIDEVNKENPSKTEITIIENIASKNETEEKLEIPKKNLENIGNGNKPTFTKSKEEQTLPRTEIAYIENIASENEPEKKSEIPKKNVKSKGNGKRPTFIKSKDQQNLPRTEIANIENIASGNETEKKSVTPKKKFKKKGNGNRPTNTKSKDQSKRQVNLDRSLIIQVDTDTGTQFSCKDCGGLYQTEKDINKHITKAHAILFKCEYCPKQLKTFETYKNHTKLHTGKEFNCSFCPKKFASKQALKDHLNCHTKEKNYKCHLCEKEFKYVQTLTRHLKIHAGTNKKILCDLCGRSFNDQSNLNAHVRTVHEKLRPFNCKICKKSYSNKRHLRDHLKLHNGENKMYKCDLCDQRRSCAKTMKIHRLKHDNKFMCRFCSKIFDNVASRIAHVKAFHSNDLPWLSCHLCGKIFSGKFSLNRHVDEHNGIKKFPCDVCGLRFTQKVVLNRHIFRKHNPGADIDTAKTKCDICKRSFKNIAVHMDRHNNRLCACDLCGNTYPNTSALNRHKSSKHFGRAINCAICDKKYLRKSALNNHTMKVHNIKIEKACEEGT